ncbi:MAG: DUF1552 domain-containing protein [Candidatus Solibacter usitatus]|nr:DUF1552 domain-containing protein [Candidatus Solibacter usitatus]
MNGKHLSRRMLLRGVGAALGLPFLDAMTPAFAAPSKSTGKSPSRMAFVYVPNGIIMQDWTPASEGAEFEFKRVMTPMAPLRKKVMVLTGLMQNGGRALGDGPGDHARAASSFLTGAHPKKTAGADIKIGISVDQVAAQRLGKATKFASMELGLEDGRLVGSCDSGYSCAYSNNLSWRSENSPMPPEINPRLVFERLFGSGDEVEDAPARARRLQYEKSVLDSVLEETKSLQTSLGSTDRRKLDEYLYSVREIEKRIETNERDSRQMAPPMLKPEGAPLDYGQHARLMYDLMTVAFQMDATRVLTFMMGREGSGRAYREIGVPDAHHGLTHHRGNEEWIEKIRKINTYHVEQFAYFIDKLSKTPDGDGTLLDSSMIIYGSGIADGNRHTHHDLPVLLAGGGNGTLKSGRHVKYASETPMANLFLSMLDLAGAPTEMLGDSKGKLNHLSGLA